MDLCNSCIPPNVTSPEYIYWMTVGGCGTNVTIGGNADSTINFLLNEVNEAVNEYLGFNFGSSLTKSRDGTFILGYSYGGLISCHAAWTRPEVSGR